MPAYLNFHEGTVSSTARTLSKKPRGPIDMKEAIKSGRWLNGDRISSNDFYEIARRLKPGWTNNAWKRSKPASDPLETKPRGNPSELSARKTRMPK
jgi:hypothetical protein